MPDSWSDDLRRYRLLDLTTFRRTGEAVTTPVRFAVHGERVIVSLQTDSGKVKRARADPVVRVAGHPGGAPLDATLRFLDGSAASDAAAILRRRHRLLFVQRLVFGRHPSRHVIAELTRGASP